MQKNYNCKSGNFHQPARNLLQCGGQKLLVRLERAGQGVLRRQLLRAGPDAARRGRLRVRRKEIALHLPFDVAEDVLGRAERFGGVGSAGDAQRRQPGPCFVGGEGFVFPQHRLPQPRQQSFFGPLLEQDARRAADDGQRHRLDAAGLGGGFPGQGKGCPGGAGLTEVGQRALLTQGRAVGHADQCPQLHQGLIVVAGGGGGLVLHDAGRERPLHLGVGDEAVVVVQPGENPEHVAVHSGHRESEADGSDGPCRIVPDAGQGAESVVVGGQLTAVLLTDDLRGLLQVPHPAVIAQPLPQLVELFLLARGQRRDVRQGSKETLIIGQCRRDAGLLEHDLAQPDVVGRRVRAEGQDAVVRVEPIEQRGGDVFHGKLPRC